MRLRITDYSKTADLNDAIVRYHTLLQMTFATNLYKIFETADLQPGCIGFLRTISFVVRGVGRNTTWSMRVARLKRSSRNR